MSWSTKQKSVVAGGAVLVAALVVGGTVLVRNIGDSASAATAATASASASAQQQTEAPTSTAAPIEGVPETIDESTPYGDIPIIRSEPIPEAVAALQASGFQPITPGQLTVATTAAVAPLSYIAEGSNVPAGVEANIAQLIADALGLEYRPEVTSWADWPLGAESGKYDLVLSNIIVTDERKERFDFATYRRALHGFLVTADNADRPIESASDISGLRVAVNSGTNQERILLSWNAELEAAGQPPAEISYYEDQAAVTLALKADRVDVYVYPNPSAQWAARADPDLAVASVIEAGWPVVADVGAVTRTGNGLDAAVEVAIDGLIANGSYGEALELWGLDSEVIDDSLLNPPGVPLT